MSLKAEINRTQQEADLRRAEEEKRIKSNMQHLKEKENNYLKGNYKKLVIDSFIKEFANNYGDSFDYNTLIKSISFTFSVDKNGNLVPEFSFNENGVAFKEEKEIKMRRFNENTYDDFISTEDEIRGSAIQATYFNNAEEYEAYENGDITFDEAYDSFDIFIPASDNKERYGEYNRINKLYGYQPISESVKNVRKAIKNSNLI